MRAAAPHLIVGIWLPVWLACCGVPQPGADVGGGGASYGSGESVGPMIGPPARLRATVGQSMGTVHQPLTLVIEVEDTLGEHAPGFSGDLEVTLHGDSSAEVVIASAVTFEGQAREQITFRPQAPGTAWIAVRDPSGRLLGARSNPVWVRPGAPGADRFAPAGTFAFWGDLHIHSNFSADATSPLSPAATYEEMIDHTTLDFGAVTDHDVNLGGARWAEVKTAANARLCQHPDDMATCYGGRHFVTLLGYEWSSTSPYRLACDQPGGCYGHRNVYFVQDDGVDIEYDTSGLGSIPMHSSDALDSDEPCELWGEYDDLRDDVDGLEFITVPHHLAAYRDRPPRADLTTCPEQCGFDAALEPLVEVFSRHGSGETPDAEFPAGDPISCRNDTDNPQSAQEALAGIGSCEHRVGMIGSGDSHDGRPGRGPRFDESVDPCATTPLDPATGDVWDHDPVRAPQAGLVCAYATGADRHAALGRLQIFDSLVERWVYATTGVRINLWFDVTVNGVDTHVMGQELAVAAGDVVEASVHVDSAEEELARVALLWLDPGNGWTTCAEWLTPGVTLEDAVNLSVDCSAPGLNIYYVKVEEQLNRENGVFVTPQSRWIDFQVDGGPELSAQLDVGWYTTSTLAAHVQARFEDVAGVGHEFVVAYNAQTHRYRLTCTTASLDLLWRTGTHGTEGTDKAASALLGFGSIADETGGSSYVSSFANPSDGIDTRNMAWSSPIWIEVP